MKLMLTITFCLLLASSVFAQIADGPVNVAAASGTAGLQEIYLAKDDGTGQAGEAAESFLTTDVPIYCVVLLDSNKEATVKMNFVAVNVRGVKPETKVISVSYKTNGKQNRVNFTGKPEGAWVAGAYRIDVFIDNKLAGNRAFEIKKAGAELPPAVPKAGNLVPAKSAPKPARRPRRN